MGRRWRYGATGAATVALALMASCHILRVESPPSPSERLLFSFERRTMLPMLGGTAARILTAEHATHGKHSLRLRLSPGHETVILDTGGFPMDWRGWKVLRVDVYRQGEPLVVNLRVSDAHGKRHWVWSQRLRPGANTLEYDLPSMSDKIDLSAVAELMWYAENPSGEVYLDAIRLGR
ncbi:MAG: hypothetical protein RMK92_02975 [Armatimonadota bacterium]|nr:hypothetical protein [Armatimonadota bacterium]